jgi:hypothetical protein
VLPILVAGQPADAPDELFYQSGLDDQVFGKIIVVD